MGKHGDIVASLFFFFIGIGAVVGAFSLEIGTPREPQPGFLPFLGGSILTALSGLLFLRGWRGQSTGFQTLGEYWRPALTVFGLIICVLIFDSLGYIIAVTSVCLIVLYVLNVGKWWLIVLTSFIVAAGSYLLFDRLLKVPLPSGILGSIF